VKHLTEPDQGFGVWSKFIVVDARTGVRPMLKKFIFALIALGLTGALLEVLSRSAETSALLKALPLESLGVDLIGTKHGPLGEIKKVRIWRKPFGEVAGRQPGDLGLPSLALVLALMCLQRIAAHVAGCGHRRDGSCSGAISAPWLFQPDRRSFL
jgi:hypothetical protein